jgi:hypothetical protein
MTCPTQVNCFRHRNNQQANDAVRLGPKSATQSAAPPYNGSARTFRLPVYQTGTNSFVSLPPNLVNPSSRPAFGAGASARNADGRPGQGNWKKQRPLGNGADRGCNITPPRRRADFQSVARDERTRGTFTGGNRK